MIRRALLTSALVLLFASPAAQAAGPQGALDSRAWELVSPVEKNGGEVSPSGEGVLQAATQGGAVAFASEASFGEALGAAPLSQYVATRSASGWSTANLTPALLSGTYSEASGDPDPYLAFSSDLSKALLSGGWACRDGSIECEAQNPPFGPGGPPGYRNLYLKEGATYAPLITAANFAAHLPPEPKELHITFLEAGADLDCVAFETESGVWEWREGVIQALAGGCFAPGFTPPDAIDVIGANADESIVFYTAAGGIWRWQNGAGQKVVSDTNLSHLPPETGAAAVAANGARLFFTTQDALLPLSDSNGKADAYEWEAKGTGSCAISPGCLGLLSSGRSGEATFVAASADGQDAFFLTAVSLLPADSGAVDLYDARAGGGFPEPQPGIECNGDDCQGPPYVPGEPAPATSVVSGPENPKAKGPAGACPKGKRRVRRGGKTRCVKRHRNRHRGHGASR